MSVNTFISATVISANVISAAVGAATLAALASAPAMAQDKGTVGIAMPTKSITRWIADGDNMVRFFGEAGYETILQYADDDIPTQVSQIENMIARGVDALVVGAIDGTTLANVLEQAAASDIPVISYDRLIRDTPNISYYTTFDNFKVGVLQGQSIVDALDIDNCNPCNIELFGGSPDDNNAYFFYNGAMSVIQPLIDQGKLAVKSGQTGMNVVGTAGWMASGAQSRMENLLSANYTDARVDAVLAPNDSLAIGIISALKGVGYGAADQPMPAISGQDAEIPSLKAIMAGEQTSTVFKDTRELAKSAVGMVNAVLEGNEPEINDTTSYDNGVKIVPSFLLTPVAVTKDNLQAVLIDSGYYTADQLK